jgi:class 3 adenylate cyclase
MRELPRGTVTFLFTDVQASTDLTRRLGARYAGVLADSRRLLRDAVAEHGGVEVDTQGDGLFAAFERARDAVLAAAAAQRSHAEHEWPGEEEVSLRMGLHTAEPHVWEEGYAGLGLTRAARICAAGHGGQVLLSRSTAGIIADEDFPGLHMRDLGAHRLAGLHWPEQIFQLSVDELPADHPPLNTPEGAGPAMETATVLITDVAGLTALIELLSPEEFRALIAQCHHLSQAVLEEFEGYSSVSFVDSTVATFRSPRAAVQAAAELPRRIAARAWPGGVELRLRVAVHSGELVTTAYGPIGHPVYVCSRLCHSAQPGQALVSEVTRGLIGSSDVGGVDLADLGERELAGAKVRVYEIVEGAPNA